MLILVHVMLSVQRLWYISSRSIWVSLVDLRSWSLGIAHGGVDHGFGFTFIL